MHFHLPPFATQRSLCLDCQSAQFPRAVSSQTNCTKHEFPSDTACASHPCSHHTHGRDRQSRVRNSQARGLLKKARMKNKRKPSWPKSKWSNSCCGDVGLAAITKLSTSASQVYQGKRRQSHALQLTMPVDPPRQTKTRGGIPNVKR